MKRFLLASLSLLLFLCGCQNNKTPTSFSAKEYCANYELFNQFETLRFPLTNINLFIGENNDHIGVLYLGGYYLTEEDLVTYDYQFKSDEHGNIYVYYGKLNEIAENIYSCNGNYIPSLKYLENMISEDIDFYIIEKEDKLYFVFEDLSLEELENYSSELFATFHDYITNEIFTSTVEKRQCEED